MKFGKNAGIQNNLNQNLCDLFVMRMFGCESFIYKSRNTKDLNSAVGRSVYLKNMMRRIEERLLEELKLGRESIIYSDGVYSYILLPESATTESIVAEYMKRVNNKLLEKFHTELYIGFGLCKCNSNILNERTTCGHCTLLNQIHEQIFKRHLNRYSAQQIMWLNAQKNIEEKMIDEYENQNYKKSNCQDDGQIKKLSVCRVTAEELEGTLHSDLFLHNVNQLIHRKKVDFIHNGGYDILAWGQWDDVFQFVMDLQTSLKKYKQGLWAISCGISIYQSAYPVHAMVEETQALMETSERQTGKNVITLFDHHYSFAWDRMLENVINEKLQAIETYFSVTNHHGYHFLQNLMELIRDSEAEVNFIRYVYLLTRMEPKFVDKENYQRARFAYHQFSRKMYQWSKNPRDREELIAAIYIYLYKSKKKV